MVYLLNTRQEKKILEVEYFGDGKHKKPNEVEAFGIDENGQRILMKFIRPKDKRKRLECTSYVVSPYKFDGLPYIPFNKGE